MGAVSTGHRVGWSVGWSVARGSGAHLAPSAPIALPKSLRCIRRLVASHTRCQYQAFRSSCGTPHDAVGPTPKQLHSTIRCVAYAALVPGIPQRLRRQIGRTAHPVRTRAGASAVAPSCIHDQRSAIGGKRKDSRDQRSEMRDRATRAKQPASLRATASANEPKKGRGKGGERGLCACLELSLIHI
eukprot:2056636-Rhodomonas_salina.7